jgi:hypothetical protein
MDLKSRIIDKREGQIVDLLVENNKLREAAAVLRDAVEFYSSSLPWAGPDWREIAIYDVSELNGNTIGGKRARKALARYDEIMLKGGE